MLIPTQRAAGVAAVIPRVLWDGSPDVQGTLSIRENPAANGERGRNEPCKNRADEKMC